MPLLFGESTIETAQLPKMAEDVSADAVRESELSQLGIVRLARRAGNGGDWPVINERPAPDVVQQATRNGCVASVGEMLSDGKLKQSELLPQVATVPELLPKALGAGWKCHGVADKEEAFAVLSRNSRSWSAELKEQFAHRVQMGHMVIVDGIDEAGNVMIRDPQHATRYEMSAEQFIKHWTGRAVWR